LADDYEDGDGEHVLSFAQAQRTARGPRIGRVGNYTVADAMDDYLRFLEGEGRSKHSLYDVRRRDQIHIRPVLGKLRAAALTTDRLRRWRDELAKSAARLRTRDGERQKFRGTDGDDGQRARRASANRTWTVLRAALNHAYHDGKIDSDTAWRKVKPFKKVDAARIRYLTIAEAKRLINATDGEFRPMVEAALQTGARYGELCQLVVHDFNPDSGTIAIRQSKSGKPRHVVLTREGESLFVHLTAGRRGNELIFQKRNGEPFAKSHQARPMAEAVGRAKIKPALSFHSLRHTWASHSVMNGVPLMVVARNLGHADTRMVEKHYGHLARSYITDAIREGAPRFGFKPRSNISPMRRGPR